MSALLWIVGIALAFRLMMRLWGRQIGAFLMRRIMKLVEQDMRRQREDFHTHQGQSPFQTRIPVDEEIHLTAPKGRKKTRPKLDDVAEDIDFEEIRKK